jgi:hypothetical protein
MIRIDVPDSHGQHIDVPARDAFLRDVSSIGPDEIVLGGDHLDCGGVFSVQQRSFTNEMAESYDDDVRAANWFLDAIQKRAPRARIYYLEGNHEQHVERWAVRTFQSDKDARMLLERFGPEQVLHLKERGIRYYKRSEFYQGISIPGTIKLGKCFFVHGISYSRNAAQDHLNKFGANVVFHHTHRSQTVIGRTVVNAGIGAWCSGTLAKLQPLWKHTEPTTWSHGYGVQHVVKSGAFMHINVPILNGQSLLLLPRPR